MNLAQGSVQLAHSRLDKMTNLVPLPATNVPSGQIEEQPLRTQEPQGALLSHLTL
jgi:hypothetical protein